MNNKGQEDNRDRFIYGDDEQSADSAPVLIGKKKRGSEKIISLVLGVVSLVLIVVIITLINKGYMIKNTVILGESPYSEESIKVLTEKYYNEKGSRSYFSVQISELERILKNEMPYIKNVSVEKKAPDTIIITLEGESAEAYITHLGSYYLLNADMKVLERTELEPIRPRLIKLDITLPSQIEVGKQIIFPEDGSMDAETYKRIYSALTDSGIRERVAYLDIKNKFELKFKMHGGTDVKIGSVKDIEEKLNTLALWIKDNPDEIRSNLNLDISILKKISVSYD